MLVLLPPSETKRVGGAGALDPGALHAPEALGTAREQVRAALVELSRDEEAAAKSLKLGVKNRGELEHNLRLESSGVMPAIERYTGVLYDALDVASLDAQARSWLDEHVLVQSALFGLLSAGDPIPAYRLSAGSRLPELGAPLTRVWGEAHADVRWADDTLLLDLRSKDYGALAPLPRGYFLNVVQRGANGEVRALNHFNKAAKGDLVRRLARSGASTGATGIDSVGELLDWAASEGLEMTASEDDRTVTLVTELGAPAPASSRRAQAR
ncbi:YaaA family protein [Leucobacter sp.]